MLRQNLRTLLTNLATFLLALALALIIWVTAIRANDPVISQFLEVPVQLVNRPADAVVVSGAQQTVQLVVEGPTSALNEVTPADFQAVVDLGDLPYGESTAAVQVQYEIDNVNLASQFPEEITVKMEREVSREIPVRADIRGEVARGYKNNSPLIDPPAVLVTGPASRVDTLAEARVTVFLDNTRETLVLSPRPIYRDQQGNVASITGLELSTDLVQITIPVEQLAGFAEKPVTVEWVGEPAAGYRLLNVSAEPVSVLVTGAPTILAALSRLRTEPIDITGLTHSFTQTVTLALPPGIALEDTQPIRARVEIEPILTSSVAREVPEIRALSEGLTATLDVDEVRVFLFGPLPVLDSLREDDLRVTLDLRDLAVGTYVLEPFITPSVDEVEVRSWQPRTITVIITNALTTTETLTETGALIRPMIAEVQGRKGAGAQGCQDAGVQGCRGVGVFVSTAPLLLRSPAPPLLRSPAPPFLRSPAPPPPGRRREVLL